MRAIILLCFVWVLFFGFLLSCCSVGVVGVAGGRVLCVGGVGVGNFSGITDALDSSMSGDTILVYPGVYFEHLVINRSIGLVGVDRNVTVVDGGGVGDVVVVMCDDVMVQNLTIQNSGVGDSGVVLLGNQTVIRGCLVRENGWSGIKTGSVCHHCVIEDTIFSGNGYGVFFDKQTEDMTLVGNRFVTNRYDGVYLDGSINTMVVGNTMRGNGDDGVALLRCQNSSLQDNLIENNTDCGMYLYSCDVVIDGNTIYRNGETGVFLRNSNNSEIRGNTVGGSNNGVVVTFYSTNNRVYNNSFNGNDVGIHVSSDAGINLISNNVFSNNTKDVVQETVGTPGFEMIFIMLSIVFVILWKGRKNC